MEEMQALKLDGSHFEVSQIHFGYLPLLDVTQGF